MKDDYYEQPEPFPVAGFYAEYDCGFIDNCPLCGDSHEFHTHGRTASELDGMCEPCPSDSHSPPWVVKLKHSPRRAEHSKSSAVAGKYTFRPGMIYFLARRSLRSIKIGYTTNPESRIQSLQTGCDEPLDLLAVVPAWMADEKRLHNILRIACVYGEWFVPCEALHAIISDARRDYRQPACVEETLPSAEEFTA